MREFDIVIAGGGAGGLAAAAIIGSTGYRVLCCDSNPPSSTAGQKRVTTRTTALFLPAVEVLRNFGLWDDLEPFAEPLRVMRIIDAGKNPPQTCRIRDFDSATISKPCFGWSVPNSVLACRLAKKIKAAPNIELETGKGVSSVLTRSHEVRIGLTDGTTARARLLIGADGRNSTVREAVRVRSHKLRFVQKALTFNLTHAAPHCGIATEIYQSGGPFTSVPLPDEEGLHVSAIVWMESTSAAAELMRLPTREFECRAWRRSLETLGEVRLASGRREWPVVAQIAQKFFAERTALIAEAAHVFPPVGAQGLNMTIGDIAALHEVICRAPEDIGGRRSLIRYHRSRHPEALRRLAGVSALNVASMTRNPVVAGLRRLGLSAAHDIKPLRNALMLDGIGSWAASFGRARRESKLKHNRD